VCAAARVGARRGARSDGHAQSGRGGFRRCSGRDGSNQFRTIF
jgi:hypothetical protein